MAFKTMYPAVAGSPTATTGNTFVAGTTAELTVSQGSVLADAPNLATITAADGRFVTVSYTSKSNNTISGLTVLEGDTTGTFPLGSTIARRYSAVDDSAIKDNLNTIIYGPNMIDVFVSPDGSDTTGDGSQSKPWREIQTAVERTANLGYGLVRVTCRSGDYDTPIVMDYDYPNYQINLNGVVNTKSITCKQHLGRVVLYASGQNILNITADGEYGISLSNGCSLIKRGVMNIASNKWGIYVGNDPINNKPTWLMSSAFLASDTNITLTGGSGSNAAIYSSWFQSMITILNLNVTNTDGGTGIKLINSPHLCMVSNLTCTGTQYSVSGGAMLAINGKWIGQA